MKNELRRFLFCYELFEAEKSLWHGVYELQQLLSILKYMLQGISWSLKILLSSNVVKSDQGLFSAPALIELAKFLDY